MKKTISRISLALAVCLFASANGAHAVEEVMKPYRGGRSLGMGGLTFTTGLYDEALFGNPAMQLQAPETKIIPFHITAETNVNFLGDIDDVSKVRSASGSAILATIGEKNLAGRNEHARFTLLLPGLYWKDFFGEGTSFSFALLVNTQTNIMLRSNTDVEFQALVDAGPAFGIGYAFKNLGLDVGANLRVLYRLGADRTLTASNLLGGQKLSFSSLGGQGVGADFDLGSMYTLPFSSAFFQKIQFGLSGNNLLQSRYKTANNLIGTVNSPPNVGNDRTLNVGIRTSLPDFWILSETFFAFEGQNIGTTYKLASAMKKLHFGAETRLSPTFSVRSGFNQGYVTGGVGINLPVVKIDIATYGEELGSNTGQQEDRRVVFSLRTEI